MPLIFKDRIERADLLAQPEALFVFGDNEGFADSRGLWHGHYWVEVSNRSSGEVLLVDITADQFGGPVITALPLGHATQYLPGAQQLVDEAYIEVFNELR